MMVFETNRPHVLDPAVHSRVGRSIHFARCTREMIEQMIRHYISLHLTAKGMKERSNLWSRIRSYFSPPPDPDLSELFPLVYDLSDRFFQHSFVGRDVTNFVIALAQVLYSRSDNKLPADIIQTVCSLSLSLIPLDLSLSLS